MKALLILSLFISRAYASGVTLKEAFDSAKLNMETLRRADANLGQAEARKNQARATLFPTLSGVGNETHIDRPKTPAGVSSAFTLTRQYSAGLRLQQPLIRGGVVSGLQQRQEEILLAQFQKDASLITLYQLVINSYYQLYLAEMDLKNLQELLKLSQNRMGEIREFTKLGRSRRGELVQAETQLLTAESHFKQGQTNLQAARENFYFYTHLEPTELAPLGELPRELSGLPDYQSKINSRPDVLANKQQIVVADKRIAVTKGGHFPQVDLVGNYYFDRTGVLRTSEWDVAVVVSVPIFQGGGVVYLTKEAVEAKRVAELNASELTRAARRDLSIQYQNFHQLQMQLNKMSDALKKAEEAYKLIRQDYKYGQVTNIEVLQTLNLYIDTKRSFDSLKTQTHLTFKTIEAQIGALP